MTGPKTAETVIVIVTLTVTALSVELPRQPRHREVHAPPFLTDLELQSALPRPDLAVAHMPFQSFQHVGKLRLMSSYHALLHPKMVPNNYRVDSAIELTHYTTNGGSVVDAIHNGFST